MTLTEENPKTDVFTCPSVSCKKTFTQPLKTINLQLDPDAPYDACPYCLTQLNADDKADVAPVVEEGRRCAYHLGYLCEREDKSSVPDECMTCRDMVACLLGDLKDGCK